SPMRAMASSSAGGRGMLPMGSVGIGMIARCFSIVHVRVGKPERPPLVTWYASGWLHRLCRGAGDVSTTGGLGRGVRLMYDVDRGARARRTPSRVIVWLDRLTTRRIRGAPRDRGLST